MKLWKKVCIGSLMGTALFSSGLPMEARAAVSSEGIQAVTGVAEVYGDGEKTAAAILTYPEKLMPHSVSADTFEVTGKVQAGKGAETG